MSASNNLLPTHQFVGNWRDFLLLLVFLSLFFLNVIHQSDFFTPFFFSSWTRRVVWCWLSVGNTVRFRSSEGDQVFVEHAPWNVSLSKWCWSFPADVFTNLFINLLLKQWKKIAWTKLFSPGKNLFKTTFSIYFVCIHACQINSLRSFRKTVKWKNIHQSASACQRRDNLWCLKDYRWRLNLMAAPSARRTGQTQTSQMFLPHSDQLALTSTPPPLRLVFLC